MFREGPDRRRGEILSDRKRATMQKKKRSLKEYDS